MAIELKDVPPELRERARVLDMRLEKYESGLLANYGNKVAVMHPVMAHLIDSLNTFFEMYPVVGMMLHDIDDLYQSVDFGHLPSNSYTAPFYLAQDRYFDLRYHLETAKKQISDGEDATYSIKEIKDASRDIIDACRIGYGKIMTDIIEPLDAFYGAMIGEGEADKVFCDLYRRPFAGIWMQAELALKYPDELDKATSMMEEAISDIDTLHGRTGIGRALLNMDGDYDINYRGYGWELDKAVRSLKKHKDNKKYIEDTLNDIKNYAQNMMNIGQAAYNQMVNDVIAPLSAVSPRGNAAWLASMENKYTRQFALINLQSTFAMYYPTDAQEPLSLIDDACSAIDSVHARIGLGEVPFNGDTQYFFACIKLYSELKKTFDSLEKQIYILENLKETAQKLKDDSKAIVDTARPKYFEMYNDVLNPLRAIPGCEDRHMRKRKPKNN